MDLEFGYGDIPDHMIPVRKTELTKFDQGLVKDLYEMINKYGLAGVQNVLYEIENQEFRSE